MRQATGGLWPAAINGVAERKIGVNSTEKLSFFLSVKLLYPVSLAELLRGRRGRGLLFFDGWRGRRIDDGGVVFHLLFLLGRGIDDRRVLFDDFLRWSGADTGITPGEDQCHGDRDD